MSGAAAYCMVAPYFGGMWGCGWSWRFGGVGCLNLLRAFFDVSWHGEVYFPLLIIPIKVEPDISAAAAPIHSNLVVLSQDV